MPGVNDWTLEPYKVVDRIFEECGAEGPWKERIKEHFEREVKQPAILEKLPWLNESAVHHLRPGQLVRYRGMVQDMLGSELFSDVYEVKPEGGGGGGTSKVLPGRYRDVVQCGVGESIDASGPRSQTGDRIVYYCVPVPGETDWVKQVYQDANPYLPSPSTSCGMARLKRPAADETSEGMESMETEEGEGEERKRVRGESWGESTAASTTSSTSTTTTTSSSVSTLDLGFPLPGMKGTPALVKVYGEDCFKLNQVVEVVAILSVSPALSSLNSSSHPLDMLGGEGEDTGGHSASPASLVPRLHCITTHAMPHTNPLLSSSSSSSSASSSASSCSSSGNVKEGRDVVKKVLEEMCLGDDVAAEHLLCHLLSSVYGRQDVTVLGKYCVNLSGIDRELQGQGYSEFVYQVVCMLVTQAHFFPLTLENINKAVFVPKKDYQTDRLTSGLLQLPDHTHLVVNEAALTEGQVDRTGVANLTALGNVITIQRLDYDFYYHSIEALTNIPVLVLSEGKSMLPSDVQIKLEVRQKDVGEAKRRVEALLSDSSALSVSRCFLTTARLADYTLTQDMQKVVQDDFTESRKTSSGEGLSASDLHRLLVLARLLALSYGETQLNQDLWEKAKVIENGRKARLPAPSTSS